MTAILDNLSQPFAPTAPTPVVLDCPGQGVIEFSPWEADFPILRPEAHCLERWLDLNA